MACPAGPIIPLKVYFFLLITLDSDWKDGNNQGFIVSLFFFVAPTLMTYYMVLYKELWRSPGVEPWSCGSLGQTRDCQTQDWL